ncbi:MAG: PIG-L deacetylase family protein [Candidatus Limnocylindrales bacterium]
MRMRRLTFEGADGLAGSASLRLLVIGAHADDIEIGCAGTILRLAEERRLSSVRWIVLSAPGPRRAEARASAEEVLADVPDHEITLTDLRDGYFPYDGAAAKDIFESLKDGPPPDIVLTHRREDAHQDHRLVAELTWNTFRDQLILEYEIPKYDGDLGTPNAYVEISEGIARRKIDLLMRRFPSQLERHWFTEATFWGLLRLRGVECRSITGLAEGHTARKIVL